MTRFLRLLVLGLPLLLGGCWDITSPAEPILVDLLAVSWQNGNYQVAAQSVVPRLFISGGLSSGGGPSGPSPVWVLHCHGPTLLAALAAAGLNLNDTLLISHMHFLIVDKSVLQPVAWRGLEDGLLRYPPLRQNFWIFLAQGPAANMAVATNPIGAYPGEGLIKSARSVAANGTVYIKRYYELEEDLFNVPFEPAFFPLVEVQPATPAVQGYNFKFPGEAVFFRDTLRGILRGDQVATWGLLTNASNAGLAAHPSIQIQSRTERLQAAVRGGGGQVSWRDGIRVRENLTVSITQYDNLGLRPRGSALPSNAALSQQIAREMVRRDLDLIRWSQKRRVDILGLGAQLAREKPGWEQTEATAWPDRYAQAPVSVQVHVQVQDEGNLVIPSVSKLSSDSVPAD